jgi:hypothetical protein
VRSRFDEPVVYHGSLTEHHGPAVKVGECGCLGLPYQECRGQLDDVERGDLWAIRWTLRLPSGDLLLCVRPESFTHAGTKIR